MGKVEEGTKEGLRMHFDLQPCRHQLRRPPDLVKDDDGASYLIFECILCGCGISLRLDSEGEIDGEFILAPERKCA
jgi:hypothetical protein